MKPGNRQFIEMVPIHTKRLLWEMGERIKSLCLSAILQKGFFFYPKRMFLLYLSNPIDKNLVTGNLQM